MQRDGVALCGVCCYHAESLASWSVAGGAVGMHRCLTTFARLSSLGDAVHTPRPAYADLCHDSTSGGRAASILSGAVFVESVRMERKHSTRHQQRQRDEAAGATAARWFVRAHSGEMSADERRALEEWLRAARRNQQEYTALEKVWEAAQSIPAAKLRALAAAPTNTGRHRPLRRPLWRMVLASMAVCLIMIATGWAVRSWYQAQPLFWVHFETTRNERKREVLPDGSVIEMNVNSRGTVGYYHNRRVVLLATGEMLFTVTRDATRPFTIDVGSGTLTVVGTRFNVRRDGDAVTVAVREGVVEVAGRAQAGTVRLTAGLRTHINAQGSVQQPQRVESSAVGAWRDGKLVFDGAPLAEAVREVMRYRERPISLADAHVAQLRLSSIFNINDTDAFLRALPRILPITVHTLPDGSVEIRGR